MENEKALEISNLLKEINYQLNNRLRCTFKHSDYTVPQISALQIIYSKGPVKLTELSKEMKLANSTVSGIIDRLEKQGLVERIRSNDDKRIVYLTLSSKNDSLKNHIHWAVNNYLSGLVDKGSPEDIEIIISGLTTLIDLLNR